MLNGITLQLDKFVALHQCFARSAEHTPDAIALVDGELHISYGLLNARANRLAHHLCTMGVQRGVRVGLLLPQSVELVIALWATLKTGAAYVPLDNHQPRQRIQQICQRANVSHLLSDTSQTTELDRAAQKIIWVFIEKAMAPPSNYPSDHGPQTSCSPHDLAYIIFTSGSTGIPKGVMVEHHNLVNFAEAMTETLSPVERSAIWLSLTRISFDISLLELLWPMTQGNRVVLAPRSHATTLNGNDTPQTTTSFLASDEILACVAQHQVTHLQCTPSLGRVLFMDALWSKSSTSIQHILVGGETCPAPLVAQLTSSTNAVIRNMYGPTETTIWSSCERIAEFSQDVPIGLPIANTHICVLDHAMILQAGSASGEIYIGGSGVARGYALQPARTAEQFVPDFFSLHPGSRLYRTGDMGSISADRKLKFIGRRDNQIKLRGVRIELGEIEAALLQCPTVLASAVLLQRQEFEDFLVAFFVSTQPNFTHTLQQHLQNILPNSMWPSRLLQLDAMPLTNSGKIDRQHLLKMLSKPAIENRDQRLSATDLDNVEAFVTAIWEENLGVGVKPNDNFFELGGTSLSAMRIATDLTRELGVELPVTILLSAPTVHGLASHIREQRQSTHETPHPSQPVQAKPASASTIICLRAGNPQRAPLVLIHTAIGQAYTYASLCQYLDHEQPVYAIESPELNADVTFLGSVQETAAYYLRELQTLHLPPRIVLGGWSFGGCVAFEMALQLAQASTHQVVGLLMFDVDGPPRWIDRLKFRATRLLFNHWTLRVWSNSILKELPSVRKALVLSPVTRFVGALIAADALGRLDDHTLLRILRFSIADDTFPYASFTEMVERGFAEIMRLDQIPMARIMLGGQIDALKALRNARVSAKCMVTKNTYIPRESLKTPIVIFRARGNRAVERWQEFTTPNIKIIECDIECDEGFDPHWSMLEEKNARKIGPMVSDLLRGPFPGSAPGF